MTMDRVAMGQTMRILVAFYQQDVKDPELTLELWSDVLSDLPDEAVNEAVQIYIREGRYFPNPVQIREIASSRILGLATPEAAWSQVVDQIREVGLYDQPKLEPFLREVVREAGGWRYLANGDEQRTRDAFIWAYKGAVERKRRDVSIGAIQRRERAIAGPAQQIGATAGE